MLDVEFLDKLRCIAYDPRQKGIDRIAACKELYTNAVDVDAIIVNLEELITSNISRASDVVKASNLLYKIKKDIGNAITHNDIDVASTTTDLMNKYVGGIDG